MTRPLAWLRRHALPAYFILAYAISWMLWLPLVASAQGWIAWRLPYSIFYFGMFGPMLASLVMTALTIGRIGLIELDRRVVNWRVPWGYYAAAVVAPIGLFFIGVLLGYAFSKEGPNLLLLGQIDYLPYLSTLGTLLVWMLAGLGEETGWRGFALPHLQKSRSALSASITLGLLWAGWHLPLFFFRDTYASMGAGGFLFFAFLLLFTSVVFTWLYNGTGGSLFIVILFHAIFNWLTASEAGGPFAAVLISAAIVLWSLYVVRRYGRENLSPLPRQIA